MRSDRTEIWMEGGRKSLTEENVQEAGTPSAEVLSKHQDEESRHQGQGQEGGRSGL